MSILFLTCCKKEDEEDPLLMIPYDPTPMPIMVPEGFPAMPIPVDNPQTVEGAELGRALFFDPVLSGDSTMSCGSCHQPALSFTDGLPVSVGIDGIAGTRSAPSLMNVGFDLHGLHWDGEFAQLEEQAVVPVESEIELHDMWPNVEEKLRRHPEYPAMFRRAFGIASIGEVTRDLAVKAIAQFERTLISSGNSKWDRYQRGEYELSDEEFLGFVLFFDRDPMIPDAECGHCHDLPFYAIQEFRNNGLDDVNDHAAFADPGRGAVSAIESEVGKFKVPTLRNIFQTAPYMHDGRFSSIDEVLDHYNSGGHGRFRNPLLRPLHLSQIHLDALKSFLMTLEDPDFLEDPAFQDPH